MDQEKFSSKRISFRGESVQTTDHIDIYFHVVKSILPKLSSAHMRVICQKFAENPFESGKKNYVAAILGYLLFKNIYSYDQLKATTIHFEKVNCFDIIRFLNFWHKDLETTIQK